MASKTTVELIRDLILSLGGSSHPHCLEAIERAEAIVRSAEADEKRIEEQNPFDFSARVVPVAGEEDDFHLTCTKGSRVAHLSDGDDGRILAVRSARSKDAEAEIEQFESLSEALGFVGYWLVHGGPQ